MGETTDQIERHIEETRQDLGANLLELEDRVRRATDWRRIVRRNPKLVIGGVVAGAVIMGWLFGLATRDAAPART